MKLIYTDTIILVDPVTDDYGSEKIGRQETVKCLLGPARSFGQAGNQQVIDADMVMYINPEDTFVKEVNNRIEGMLVITSLGESASDSWYRITSVNVARRNLLDNSTDNIQCNLKKTTEIQSVS